MLFVIYVLLRESNLVGWIYHTFILFTAELSPEAHICAMHYITQSVNISK